MRELAPSVSNPRTQSQMTQRVKLSNLVNFYRASQSWMQRAFEVKPENNSDYNRFVSLNLTNNPIYLTKQEANAGACVVAPYRVTEGTLPSIEVQPFTDNWITNIFTGNLTELTDTLTVGGFAAALLAANGGIVEGDQLSFIRLTQQTNPNTGMPYVIVRKYEVLLNPTSTALLSSFLPLDYFAVYTAEGNNSLGVVNSGQAGGFVLVLSRTMGSRILVSSQDVITANNEAIINSHSGSAALQAAIASYGEGEEVFLSSATASGITSSVMGISLLSVAIDGDDYTDGDIAGTWGDLGSYSVVATFSKPVSEGIITATARFVKGFNDSTVAITDLNFTEGKIAGLLPLAVEGEEDSYLTKLTFYIDGVAYSINFSDGSLG